jgi:ABC-type transport system involved in multi-copper enzyme maturation permease subunit
VTVSRLLTAVRAEVRKTSSTRMWWILLLVMVGYVGVIAAFLAISFATMPEQVRTPGAPSLDDRAILLTLYSLGLPIGYVFPVVLGVLAMTAEYRYQTITPTFLAEPRRGTVLAAKLVVVLGLGLGFGMLALAASVAGAAPVVAGTGHAALLGDAGIWRALAQAVLGMVLWAGIGVGVGAVLRNQVAAIVVILAFSQLVEPLARIGLSAWSATREVAQYLPGAAADALVGASIYTMGGGPARLLEWWQGALVLAGYAALFCVLGALTTLRRDIA